MLCLSVWLSGVSNVCFESKFSLKWEIVESSIVTWWYVHLLKSLSKGCDIPIMNVLILQISSCSCWIRDLRKIYFALQEKPPSFGGNLRPADARADYENRALELYSATIRHSKMNVMNIIISQHFKVRKPASSRCESRLRKSSTGALLCHKSSQQDECNEHHNFPTFQKMNASFASNDFRQWMISRNFRVVCCMCNFSEKNDHTTQTEIPFVSKRVETRAYAPVLPGKFDEYIRRSSFSAF